jgi:hypothetical protein
MHKFSGQPYPKWLAYVLNSPKFLYFVYLSASAAVQVPTNQPVSLNHGVIPFMIDIRRIDQQKLSFMKQNNQKPSPGYVQRMKFSMNKL